MNLTQFTKPFATCGLAHLRHDGKQWIWVLKRVEWVILDMTRHYYFCKGDFRMKKWLIAALFGVVLTLGACGGGGDGASDNNGDSGDAGATDNAAAEEV